MKKIAFIINVFRDCDFKSGGEKLFYELLTRAMNDGYSVDLYCTTYLGNRWLENKINITYIGNPRDFKWADKVEKIYAEIKKHIEKNSYDYVVSENITPPLDIAVLQGHSLVHYCKMAGNPFSKLIFLLKKFKNIRYQKKWFKQGYRKIFVPSEILKKEIMSNFNIEENKFTVIYPGVDIPKDVVNSDFIDIIEKKREITFGISAPSFGKKGGYIFLNALKILKDQEYTFKAKIIYPRASKNLYLNLLVKFYGLKKHIEFLPYQDSMQEFYSSIDCLVMPSLLETFGLVALEAMANKTVPIVSSCSGASEIINEVENGFIFDIYKNPEKNLADKMLYIIKNTEKLPNLSENAFNTALKFNWQNTYKTFIEALKEL
jgi:glycosyltransferase involved in cell wall biosynthesis